MKLYAVMVGEYEDKDIGFCSNNLDTTIDFIYDSFHSKTIWEIFNTMQCWEDDKQIFIYGMNSNDVVNLKRDITKEELKNDILKYINGKQNQI